MLMIIEIIPMMVWVLPVPGYNIKKRDKENNYKITYRSLDKHDVVFRHLNDLLQYFGLTFVELMMILDQIVVHLTLLLFFFYFDALVVHLRS